MVTAVKSQKVSVELNKMGNIVLKRNGKIELRITHPDLELFDMLKELLEEKKDFDSFAAFFSGHPSELSLVSWLFNVLALDKERKISWMFERAIVELN